MAHVRPWGTTGDAQLVSLGATERFGGKMNNECMRIGVKSERVRAVAERVAVVPSGIVAVYGRVIANGLENLLFYLIKNISIEQN